MSAPENFREALICVYRENPCQVLPNALWKSLPWLKEFETVAGKLNNQTQPEKLDRSCGFEGEDIWWVLRK